MNKLDNKKTILLIIDFKNWAFDNITHYIEKHNNNNNNIFIKVCSSTFFKSDVHKINLDEVTHVLFFLYSNYWHHWHTRY